MWAIRPQFWQVGYLEPTKPIFNPSRQGLGLKSLFYTIQISKNYKIE